MKEFIITVLVAVGLFLLVAGLSWIATCGLIYLIALCFGWEFSWLIATGIWLGLALVSGLFSVNARR